METAVTNDQTKLSDVPANEAYSSGVSWASVIAGAFVLAALWLILLALGSGLTLSSVSPWRNTGVSAFTIGVGAVVWLILSQILASAMGGYSKWFTSALPFPSVNVGDLLDASGWEHAGSRVLRVLDVEHAITEKSLGIDPSGSIIHRVIVHTEDVPHIVRYQMPVAS